MPELWMFSLVLLQLACYDQMTHKSIKQSTQYQTNYTDQLDYLDKAPAWICLPFVFNLHIVDILDLTFLLLNLIKESLNLSVEPDYHRETDSNFRH